MQAKIRGVEDGVILFAASNENGENELRRHA